MRASEVSLEAAQREIDHLRALIEEKEYHPAAKMLKANREAVVPPVIAVADFNKLEVKLNQADQRLEASEGHAKKNWWWLSRNAVIQLRMRHEEVFASVWLVPRRRA